MATSSHRLTTIPPLVEGDALSAEEFLRRYEAAPETVRAELIDGVVRMTPPASESDHGDQQVDLITWLGTYRSATPGVKAGDNTTVVLESGAVVQPDGYLRIAVPGKGQTGRTDRGYVAGAPELVAEVAGATARFDMNQKLRAYARAGVREYLVWRTRVPEFHWFILRDGEFEPLPPDADGVTRSRVFPGLWLDTAALLAERRQRVTEVLNLGLASPEHAAFVASLQMGGGTSP